MDEIRIANERRAWMWSEVRVWVRVCGFLAGLAYVVLLLWWVAW